MPGGEAEQSIRGSVRLSQHLRLEVRPNCQRSREGLSDGEVDSRWP